MFSREDTSSLPVPETKFNGSEVEMLGKLEWTEGNSIPLFKKGSTNESVNYRPVSLTSVIC